MKKRLIAMALTLALAVGLTSAAFAAQSLFFVAVNDTIPLTLTAEYQPYYSGGTLYVPYTAFDASPGGIVSAYNAAEGTFVLFTKNQRLIFDLNAGTTTDEDKVVESVSTTYRNGILFVPAVTCASHFALSVSLLTSKSGCDVLRFTTGSEVYEDSLFLEKAENLISNRIDQYEVQGPIGSNTENPTGNEPGTPGDNPGTTTSNPAVVYLAFTDATTMQAAAQVLAGYSLRGTFFLTADEIRDNPVLVRELYCAGHLIGLRVSSDAQDATQALRDANDALDAVLQLKSVLALLPAGQAEDVTGYRVFAQSDSQPSAQETAASATPQLYISSGDAADALRVFYNAGASMQLLRETSLMQS